jgi:hypothetical protein
MNTRTVCISWCVTERHQCNIIVPADIALDDIVWEDVLPELEDGTTFLETIDRSDADIEEEDEGHTTFDLTRRADLRDALEGNR